MAAEMLGTERMIKPSVDVQQAKKILYGFYGFQEKEILEVTEMDSYDDRNFYIKTQKLERNGFARGSSECKEFVLKILNSLGSQKKHIGTRRNFGCGPDHGHLTPNSITLSSVHPSRYLWRRSVFRRRRKLYAEHLLREHLKRRGFLCPSTVRNVSNELNSVIVVEHKEDRGQLYKSRHVVRLLTFVPGQVLGDAPKSAHLFVTVGQYLADMHSSVKDVRHPALDIYHSIWNLESVPQLRNVLSYVSDEWKRQQIERVLEDFEVKVVPEICNLERGTIHGDFNDRNIIVKQIQNENPTQDNVYEVCGVIDFGDIQTTCIIFDLACTMAYMILINKGTFPDPADVGACVLSGYSSRRPIREDELKILPYCVLGRYAQSLVMGAYSYAQDPSNEYLLLTSKEGWDQLDYLLQLGPEELLKKWLNKIDISDVSSD